MLVSFLFTFKVLSQMFVRGCVSLWLNACDRVCLGGRARPQRPLVSSPHCYLSVFSWPTFASVLQHIQAWAQRCFRGQNSCQAKSSSSYAPSHLQHSDDGLDWCGFFVGIQCSPTFWLPSHSVWLIEAPSLQLTIFANVTPGTSGWRRWMSLLLQCWWTGRSGVWPATPWESEGRQKKWDFIDLFANADHLK